jgi:peptidyl-prolyl cis-trans isomerase SurA
MQIAEKARKILDKAHNKITDDQLIKLLCDSVNGKECIKIEHNLYSKSDNKIIDSIVWKKGVSKIFTKDKNIYFVNVRGIVKPELKKLNEVRGLVTAEYQNKLEEKWIIDLKNKYKIEINKDLLLKIADKFKK